MGKHDDDDDMFDFFVMEDLDRLNSKGGGCMLSLLLLITPAIAIVAAIVGRVIA